MKLFRLFTEAAGWLQIAASPLLIGLLAGAIVFFYVPGAAGTITAIILVLAGLIIGIVWASKVARKQGTINYISKIYRSPEIDKEPKP